MWVDLWDIITCATFGDDRLRSLGVGRGQISHFPTDLHCRPYNTLALPCECVIIMMKKCSKRCKHCAVAVVRRSHKFSPHRRPLPGGAGRPKFIQLKMVTYLHLQTQFGEDRCTQFWVILVTDPHTHKQTQTHRQDLLKYTAPPSLARSVIITVTSNQNMSQRQGDATLGWCTNCTIKIPRLSKVSCGWM